MTRSIQATVRKHRTVLTLVAALATLFLLGAAGGTVAAQDSISVNDQATASDTFTQTGQTSPGVLVNASAGNESTILLTYTASSGDLVVAGNETFTAANLNNDEVVIPVQNVSGFPGDHTAHVVPTANLSQTYGPGDIVSTQTAGNITTSATATVFQGTIDFGDQSVDNSIEEGDSGVVTVNATLDDGAGGNTNYVVDVHPTDGNGQLVGTEFVASTDVINGSVTDAPLTFERVPSGGTFNEFPRYGTDSYVAMIHVVDDGAAVGDTSSPGQYPVLPHTSASGAVAGGVTDNATITATLNQSVTFNDQEISGGSVDVTNVSSDGVNSTVIVTYQGTTAGDAVIAGLAGGSSGTVYSDETVTVDIANTSNVSGQHTAHIIPTANLSTAYQRGDVVSTETLNNISDNSAANVTLTINGQEANDLNGDGLVEDVNGDGSATVADVQALFQNRNDGAVQANTGLFNFAGLGDGRVSIFDIQALFYAVTADPPA